MKAWKKLCVLLVVAMSINMAAFANAPELPSENVTVAIPEDIIADVLEIEGIEIHDETVIELGEAIPTYGISEGQVEAATYETYPLFVDDELVAWFDVTRKAGAEGYDVTLGEDAAAVQQAAEKAGTSVDCVVFLYAADGLYVVTPDGEVYLALKMVLPEDAIEELDAAFFSQRACMEPRTRTVVDFTEEAASRAANSLESKLLEIIPMLQKSGKAALFASFFIKRTQ